MLQKGFLIDIFLEDLKQIKRNPDEPDPEIPDWLQLTEKEKQESLERKDYEFDPFPEVPEWLEDV